jgi:hypothetical protein
MVFQWCVLIHLTFWRVASPGSTLQNAKGVHIPLVCFGPIAQRAPVPFLEVLPEKRPVVISTLGDEVKDCFFVGLDMVGFAFSVGLVFENYPHGPHGRSSEAVTIRLPVALVIGRMFGRFPRTAVHVSRGIGGSGFDGFSAYG